MRVHTISYARSSSLSASPHLARAHLMRRTNCEREATSESARVWSARRARPSPPRRGPRALTSAGRRAVAAAREGRRAAALELEFPPLARRGEHLAKRDGAPVAVPVAPAERVGRHDRLPEDGDRVRRCPAFRAGRLAIARIGGGRHVAGEEPAAFGWVRACERE